MNDCPLCLNTHVIQRKDVPDYYHCPICDLVYKAPYLLVSSETEKARYLTHNNDVDDLGYQQFVKPIVDAIKIEIPHHATGLDFGAGTGPVITKLLEDAGYSLNLYDPFFHTDRSVLELIYDYIVCCEVMEHFYYPRKEFELLSKLLRKGGQLFCMTHLIMDDTPFKTWHYRNDKTHVSFYSAKTIQWIKLHFGFASADVKNRLIVFTK